MEGNIFLPNKDIKLNDSKQISNIIEMFWIKCVKTYPNECKQTFLKKMQTLYVIFDNDPWTWPYIMVSDTIIINGVVY